MAPMPAHRFEEPFDAPMNAPVRSNGRAKAPAVSSQLPFFPIPASAPLLLARRSRGRKAEHEGVPRIRQLGIHGLGRNHQLQIPP